MSGHDLGVGAGAVHVGAGRPVLAHVCGRYLPVSETFTHDLIRRLPSFDACVIAQSLENLDLFPLPDVTAPAQDADGWRRARARDAVAVVSHFGPQITRAMPLALVLDRPAVTIFHGYDISRLLRDRRWVERYRAAFALGMQALCISEAGRRQLLAHGCPSEQTAVIHLGVDTARFAYVPPSRRWQGVRARRLLTIARLVPKKGIDVAFRAMHRLRDRRPDVQLRVIGEGPERERLERMRDEWRLDNVTLLGALEHRATQAELAAADLYLQPSVTAESGDQEGIPVSLMEALACGVPVISTRHSGIPELVVNEEMGLLVQEGDDEGLAEAIARLAADRECAERFSAAGRAHVVREFDQARQVERFDEYFRALAADRACRPAGCVGRRAAGARRRALIVQAIEPGLLARKLVLLAARHPDMRFDLLAETGAASVLRQVPLVDRVFEYEGPRLTLRAVGRSRLAALREAAYDLAIVPYDNDTGEGFAPARRLAAVVGARAMRALTLRDTELTWQAPPHACSFSASASTTAGGLQAAAR